MSEFYFEKSKHYLETELKLRQQRRPAYSLRAFARDLEMSPTGQAYVVARSNFEKLMQRVNQQISEGMDKGVTSSIITLG